MSNYLENINLMVVDSQPFMGQLQRQILRVLGARHIEVFETAESAWEAFKRRPADIVFSGWRLGPMNGIDLTRRLRSDDESPNQYVPIVMVTAYREEEHVRIARDAGVNEYVIKPISPKSLFSRIESVVERPRRYVRVRDFFGPDRRRMEKAITFDCRRGAAKKLAEKSDAFAATATITSGNLAADPFAEQTAAG